jgi:hypothetical protein
MAHSQLGEKEAAREWYDKAAKELKKFEYPREEESRWLASGLTLQFEVVEGTAGKFRLRVFGDNVPFGNRKILFGANGAHVGGGTFSSGECVPGWLEPVDT